MPGLTGAGTFDSFFGDGSDGNSVPASFTRDMFFSGNILLNASNRVSTNNWRMYVRGQLTIDSSGLAAGDVDGIVRSNGGDAAGSAGGISPTGFYYGSSGGNGGSGSGTAGQGGVGAQIFSIGGTGANGSNGLSTLGGAAGTPNPFPAAGPQPHFRSFGNAINGTISYLYYAVAAQGGMGGGGGGVTTGSNPSAGGGGGGGGGVLYICARELVVIGSNVHMAARGGRGAAGGAAPGGGGGGGGGGGAIIITFWSRTGQIQFNLAGGTTGGGGQPNGPAATGGSIFTFQV
jgi:hypothetical protein